MVLYWEISIGRELQATDTSVGLGADGAGALVLMGCSARRYAIRVAVCNWQRE